jgi:hypothetical protein
MRNAMRSNPLRQEQIAALDLPAAQQTASKLRGPCLCRPHGGAPDAATNADAAGANCGWRDARAGRRARGGSGRRANERGRVGL